MDDKTLKIEAKFADQGGPGEDKVFDDAMAKAEAIAERNAALLGTFVADTFGATGSPEDFKKPKGTPGRPKKDKPTPEEEEVKSKYKFLNKILENTQKVVIALNGTNGRVTKAMAVFNRAIKLSTEFVDKGSESKKKNTEDSLDGAEAVAEKGAKSAAVSATAVATGLGGIVSVVGATVAVFASLNAITYIAGKLMTSLADKLKEVTGNFSAAVQVAEAVTQIAELQQQMQNAQQVGNELAVMEASNRELKVSLSKNFAALTDLLSEPLSVLMSVTAKVLDVLTAILNAVSTGLEFMYGLGETIVTAAGYMSGIIPIYNLIRGSKNDEKVSEAQAKASKLPGSFIDPLGDLANLNVSKADRNRLRQRGFTP
jgi:hypothetical protein